MLAALGLAEACTLGAEVRVLGGSADQSENVVRYTDGWTARSTIAALLSDRAGGREAGVTRSRIRLRGGGMVDALAASSRAVRGPHPSRLRIDEATSWTLVIFDAALGQTMARGGVPAQTVISSTHHYPDGTMTEVLRRRSSAAGPSTSGATAARCRRPRTRRLARPGRGGPQAPGGAERHVVSRVRPAGADARVPRLRARRRRGDVRRVAGRVPRRARRVRRDRGAQEGAWLRDRRRLGEGARLDRDRHAALRRGARAAGGLRAHRPPALADDGRALRRGALPATRASPPSTPPASATS
jgi:hypothetical protein